MTQYSDKWGDVIDRAVDNCVEIRWFDTTANMSGDDFSAFITRFAEQVETCKRTGALVDAVQFKMDMSKMNMGWRDANIIPRYNKAGIKKFAFVMPSGMLAIGKPPIIDGPADFPTAYFGKRQDALAWLNA